MYKNHENCTDRKTIELAYNEKLQCTWPAFQQLDN